MRTISKAPRFCACGAARRYATERRRTLRGGALCARQEVLGDDLAGGIFAAATASANGKLALHFEQGARAVVNGITNLTVTYCVADAYVHLGPSSIPAATAASHGVHTIANKNDCQLHRVGWAPFGGLRGGARLGAVREFAVGPGAPRGKGPRRRAAGLRYSCNRSRNSTRTGSVTPASTCRVARCTPRSPDASAFLNHSAASTPSPSSVSSTA
jgi:hypothetical protein